MASPLFSPATAAKLVTIRHRGDATSRLFWSDAYTVKRLDRPAGWDVGTHGEGWQTVTQPAGVPTVGRLLEGGVAGMGDQVMEVITTITPFRFRMDRRADIRHTDRMVVGARTFEVTQPVITDAESDSMWVYLTEVDG